ncbi:MAG: 4-(cytidine 5'-diphospho)-2-C-methyl-D-erythritol kinase [Chloroflexi bacterium]|nr:4-(cytidine 5'-diphospho)-2-C-methyl-D-erythritol kinase [Chloroflexota bacterium]
MGSRTEPESRKAFAKVNLTFEVIGKRADGYHEVVSVMQAIDLCDVLTFEPRESLYLACSIPELVSPNNLVFRAARLMQDAAGQHRGVAISLTKGIPLAGGLGGGSSDAAAVLRSLNDLWQTGLSAEKLSGLGAGLGSDVPFFCSGSTTALAEGRGERVTALPSLRPTWVVLAVPDIRMADKTGRMYACLDASRFSDGHHARRVAGLIERGESVVSELCYNAFDNVAYSFFPGLERYRQSLLAAGADEVHVAGAGPVLFTITGDRARGVATVEKLRSERVESYLVRAL